MISSPTIRWVLLALAGLLVAVAVAVLAAELTSQRIGLASEPVQAGKSLAPPAPNDGNGGNGGTNAKGGKQGPGNSGPATTTSPTTPAPPTTTAAPTTTVTPPVTTSPPPTTTPTPTTPDDYGSGGEHEGDD